jgi:hypothetical protein
MIKKPNNIIIDCFKSVKNISSPDGLLDEENTARIENRDSITITIHITLSPFMLLLNALAIAVLGLI